jgi:type II secretory pathway pseudopilin PulG
MFDSGAATIVLVIIAIIALPIILYNIKKRSRRMKLLKDFGLAVERAKLTISQHEHWKNSYIIGLDSNSRRLLYIHKENGKSDEFLIDLSEIEKCRIESYNKTSGGQAGSNGNSDRIELVLGSRKPGIQGKVLEIYDNKEFMPTADDYALAERWQKVIIQALEK